MKTTNVQIQWRRKHGWMYQVYEFGDDEDGPATISPVATGPLSGLVPGVNDMDTATTTVHAERIKQIVEQRYPGAQVELGKVPANLT